MQQKVQFIAAMIHEPELLILDEPFSGARPGQHAAAARAVLEQHRRGATVVFSTHVMVQAEQICDHVVMIHDGKKVVDDPVADLRARYDPSVILFEPLAPGADLAPLGAVPGIAQVTVNGAGARLDLAPGADPASIMPALAAAVAPARLELHRPTLEDIFVQKVTEGHAEVSPAEVRDKLHEPSVVEEL
jgi:ABC-2 type transport system ATP-binding protein